MRIRAGSAVLGSAATIQSLDGRSSRASELCGTGDCGNRPAACLIMAAERGIGGTGVAPAIRAVLG
jgi:hypothetical protein